MPFRPAPSCDTVVVIPACNEAERIGGVLVGVHSVLPDATVLVVDDGSRDHTAACAESHGAVVLRHPFNLGYGAALQTGYLWAARHDCRRLVQLDADGQHLPESIPTLLAALDAGADLALGSRYLVAGDAPRTSFLRRVGSRFFAHLVTLWTGVPVTDPTSGFQAMNGAVLREVVRDDFPEDHPDADVLIALWRKGVRIVEVPVRMRERLGGVSMHRGSRVAFYAYKMLLRLCLMPIRRRSPFRAGRLEAAGNA
ncbi:MAG: glycosyltransferase family 2 protein [Planctomycetota bacterium]